jgi:trehalose 6-phosphate phosphatase
VKNILGKRELSRLEQFVTHDTLIAFDFDGTLAPIARDPLAARLRKSTSKLLHRIADRYPTAVLSSRPRADVLVRLNGAPIRVVVCNHGLEPSPEAASYHQLVKTWLPRLREALNDQSGVELENKLYTLTIHYRRARSKRGARTVIERAVGDLGSEARVIEGKFLMNVLPANAPSKGRALLALRTAVPTERTLYVGEDLTEDHLFGSNAPQSVLGVRVGRAARSRASHYLSTQADIDQLLARLLEFH